MAVDLSLDPSTLRFFADKARTLSADLEAGYEDGRDHEIDLDAEGMRESHHHDALAEEETDDQTEEELRELIDDLNIDEAADLVAIVWIGRGDYGADDWEEARSEARGRAQGKTSKYLLGMPLLADHIDAGLDALNL
ncbi:hypothetical protein J2R99_003350 [Rhodopseudomonas julia]|uniref:DUF3775 domain-containing protein n=1 Tax=Rhodopseudomonas julia TaxID=200617 RepID=A0ABU0CAD1_9BRAD|nr:DUF3775 domain-containing protein [Rhodopseudomonas julia]MDQ0327481.1 hypothetical protein [Rhodopseudomonas julia]